MSTYMIAGIVCHATCHDSVRYCARGFSRLADSTCRKVYGSEDAVDLVSFELRRSKFFTFCRALDRLLPCCCCYKSDRNPSKIEACALQNHSPQREIRNCIFERAMRISMRIIIVAKVVVIRHQAVTVFRNWAGEGEREIERASRLRLGKRDDRMWRSSSEPETEES
jgi:hypothetical protein